VNDRTHEVQGSIRVPSENLISDPFAIRPYRIHVPQDQLDDLHARLVNARWPEQETVDDMRQGVPIATLRPLIDYWRDSYDWRATEARLNQIPQYVTNLDGLDIHFLHVQSPHADALPMIMTHGWPGSIIELLDLIEPLTDPTRHGGRAEDAFHLVFPSLPGFGFSEKPSAPGWDRVRIAHAWHRLMERLGYDRYVSQGGDWGATVAQSMAMIAPPGLIGIHIDLPTVLPAEIPFPTEEEQAALDAIARFYQESAGYFQLQMTRPQTIGYALADSPIGQAAWIYEKFLSWTDSDGDPERLWSKDVMLDDIMFYWITNSAASSARLYWENAGAGFEAITINIPVAVSIFPREHYLPPRAWAEKAFPQLIYWNKAEKGGHFAAFEQPHLFANELRAAFRSLR
jgi:epoxide hydrolase